MYEVNMKFLILVILVVSCSSKPKLYPNQKYKNVGENRANADVEVCLKEADEYLKSSKGKQVAKSAGTGAAIGAAIGTVGGMFTGNLGRGIIRGGAMGTAGGAAAGAMSPDQLKQRYVNQCLNEKGYQVIGWD
jgi:outer membrane lipoprotein SlyB